MRWGIPIATDTAFSLGIMSLLGRRVRPVLLVFLTAETIVDDILAVLEIAVFYTETISWPALGSRAYCWRCSASATTRASNGGWYTRFWAWACGWRCVPGLLYVPAQ